MPRIPQSSSITGSSSSDCLVSYPGHSFRESYLSAEVQLVYSSGSAEWATQTHVWGGLTPLQICSRCILQPKPTGPPGYSLRWGLPPCRPAVDVFYSLSRLDYQDTRWGGVYSSAEMQSVYSTAPADWATIILVGGLPLCRSSVGVFFRLGRLGHPDRRLGRSYPSADLQSVYSTAEADWAKACVCLCLCVCIYVNL